MVSDERTYIKVHDGMPDHPKIDGLSDKAFRLLVTMWCWCSRHLTDGRIPAGTWGKRSTPSARRELVEAGLVEVAATDVRLVQTAAPDMSMHDYLEHQRSAEEVADLREKKKVASAKGNHDRWHIGRRGKPSKTCPLCPQDDDAPAEDPPPDLHEEVEGGPTVVSHLGSQVGSQLGLGLGSQNASDRDPHLSPETEGLLRNPQTETEPPPPEGGAGGNVDAAAPAAEAKTASRKRSARNDGERIPDDWWPTERDQQWFRDNLSNLAGQGSALTHEFVGYWRTKPGKEARKLDWSLTWQTWMRKESRNAPSQRRAFGGRPNTNEVVSAGLDLANRYAEAEANEEHQASIHHLPIRGAS